MKDYLIAWYKTWIKTPVKDFYNKHIVPKINSMNILLVLLFMNIGTGLIYIFQGNELGFYTTSVSIDVLVVGMVLLSELNKNK